MQSVADIFAHNYEIAGLIADATYKAHAFGAFKGRAFGPYTLGGPRFKGRAGTICAFRLVSQDMRRGMNASIVAATREFARLVRRARECSVEAKSAARDDLCAMLKAMFCVNIQFDHGISVSQGANEIALVRRAAESLLAATDHGHALMAGLDEAVRAGNANFFMSIMRGVPQLKCTLGLRHSSCVGDIHCFSLFAGQLVYGNEASVNSCTVLLKKDMKPLAKENANAYKVACEMLHLANVSPPYMPARERRDGVSLASLAAPGGVTKDRVTLLKAPFFCDRHSSLQGLLRLSRVPTDALSRKFILEAAQERDLKQVLDGLHLAMRMEQIDLAISSSDLCSCSSLADVAKFWPNAVSAVEVVARRAIGPDALRSGDVRAAVNVVIFFAGPVLRSYDEQYGRSCSSEALDFVSGACHLVGYKAHRSNFHSFFTRDEVASDSPVFADKVATALRAYELIGDTPNGMFYTQLTKEHSVCSAVFNSIKVSPRVVVRDAFILSAVRALDPQTTSIPMLTDFAERTTHISRVEAHHVQQWKRSVITSLSRNIKTRFAAFDALGVCPKRFLVATNAEKVAKVDEQLKQRARVSEAKRARDSKCDAERDAKRARDAERDMLGDAMLV